MNDEERPVNQADVEQIAAEVGVVLTPGTGTFDLDTPANAAFQLHGTYEQSQMGIESAYSDLARYRVNLRSYIHMITQQED